MFDKNSCYVTFSAVQVSNIAEICEFVNF